MRLKTLSILIISSVLAIGLFGVFGINMTNYNGHHSCPISVLSSDDCSPSASPLSEAFHHISGLQNFAQGAINADASSLILSILLIIAFAFLVTSLAKLPALQTSFNREYLSSVESYYPERQFLRWLALRQKRDPHALQWVHDYS